VKKVHLRIVFGSTWAQGAVGTTVAPNPSVTVPGQTILFFGQHSVLLELHPCLHECSLAAAEEGLLWLAVWGVVIYLALQFLWAEQLKRITEPFRRDGSDRC
jgi:hypothetical protein